MAFMFRSEPIKQDNRQESAASSTSTMLYCYHRLGSVVLRHQQDVFSSTLKHRRVADCNGHTSQLLISRSGPAAKALTSSCAARRHPLFFDATRR